MLNDESQKYLDNFYEPQFSAYDFMILFCTISSIKNINSFSRDNLFNYIVYQKKLKQYKIVLCDICLKNNGVFSYSINFDEAISKLKMAGILYTISPESDSTIYIGENLDISGMLKPRIEYVTELVNFVNDYQKYEIQRITDVHRLMYDQESKDNEAAILCLRRISYNSKKEE